MTGTVPTTLTLKAQEVVKNHLSLVRAFICSDSNGFAAVLAKSMQRSSCNRQEGALWWLLLASTCASCPRSQQHRRSSWFAEPVRESSQAWGVCVGGPSGGFKFRPRLGALTSAGPLPGVSVAPCSHMDPELLSCLGLPFSQGVLTSLLYKNFILSMVVLLCRNER